MRRARLSFYVLLLVALECRSGTLDPFTTDGCSMWFDGTQEQPYLWRHCCVAHDLEYWQGGTEEQRLKSDEKIRSCVTNAQGKAMADYMYSNIRWGGSPYWMTPYRWGYGWDYWEGFLQRGYKTPSAAEQLQIDALMPDAKRLVIKDALLHPADKKATEQVIPKTKTE